MQFRLPEMFCDAKQSIEESLCKNHLILSKYNSSLVNMCEVTTFKITDELEPEKVGTLHLNLTYKERIITKYDKFETRFMSQDLMVLSTKGDPIWPYLMVTKVWDGDYPSTVAVNSETGVVYFVYLLQGAMKLVEFAQLKENQLEAVRESLNDLVPYRIKLDEDAMFKVLGEVEGTKCLHDTLYIEFNCGITFKVRCEKEYGD